MNRLAISGYKSIEQLDLKLRPINILIGGNGSGKSNLLSFFELLKNLYNRNLKTYVALRRGMDAFLFQGRQVTQQISAHLYFDKNEYSFRLQAGDEHFVVIEERVWQAADSDVRQIFDIARLSMESTLAEQSSQLAISIQVYLSQLEKYHFHDTSANSPFTKLSNIHNDIHRLYDKGDNLAAFLYGIKQEDAIRYKLIVKTIQSIAPYFRDFAFYPDHNGDLRLLWNDKYSSVVYGVNDLSDGTKRFIALATLFLQPKLPQVIIIDEPELGLHPAAISKLAGLIQSATQRGCQVIAATQSTDLISHFEPEDIVTVDQYKGRSRFKRLSAQDLQLWVNDYSMGELWKRNIITSGQPAK